MIGRLFECVLFVCSNVGSHALGESVDEEGALSLPIQDDGAVTAGFALTRACDPLFQNTTAEIGIDLALLGTSDGIHQNGVRDLVLSSKQLEPCILEDPHNRTTRNIYHTMCYILS